MEIAIRNGVYNTRYDGYIATIDCDYGAEYILTFDNKKYLVAVSDCLSPIDKTEVLSRRYSVNSSLFASQNPQGTYSWLVDIDKRIWGDHPQIPTLVILQKVKGINNG